MMGYAHEPYTPPALHLNRNPFIDDEVEEDLEEEEEGEEEGRRLKKRPRNKYAMTNLHSTGEPSLTRVA